MENFQQHCYAMITPIEEESIESSKIIKTECFNTFADSMFAGAKGRVRLERSGLPEPITEKTLKFGIGPGSFRRQGGMGINWDYLIMRLLLKRWKYNP